MKLKFMKINTEFQYVYIYIYIYNLFIHLYNTKHFVFVKEHNINFLL